MDRAPQVIGVIEKAGANAGRFPVGTRIGIPWLHRTDGTCRYCLGGSENLCDSPEFTGYTVNGGYAEYIVAPEKFIYGKSTGEQLDVLLNTKSGLLGISGISGDMRQIVAAMKDGHPRAKLAFEIFTHRLQAGIGGMIAVLDGIDALVFTAGIGENSTEVRATACANFTFLGLKLDAAKNAQPSADQDIFLSDSAVRVLVVRAHEDWAIARDCWRIMSARIRGRASVN